MKQFDLSSSADYDLTKNNQTKLIWLKMLLQQLATIFIQLVNFFTAFFIKERKVIVVGSNQYGIDLFHFFNSKKSVGYSFMGFFDDDISKLPYRQLFLGNLTDIKAYCVRENIDEIYFTVQESNTALINELANFADQNFIYFRMVGNPATLRKEKQVLTTFYMEDVPVMALRREPLSSRFNQVIKRSFDIVFSLLVLLVLIPFVFPIIALAIKLESKGSIFFVQKRPGRKNQLFNCFKFRSMCVNHNTEQQATKKDARITKVGAFLRKTNLDELPQFINVLLGDMSVVGPRPNMIKQLEFYSQHIDNYSFRHFITPGITGLAQVKGYRGETQSMELMQKRVELDIAYMQNWSLWLDIKIIFLTAWNMLKGEKNAY